MQSNEERKRLEAIYDGLRQKLLDLTRRNQLLNYNLSPRSRRFIQIFDVSLQGVHDALVVDERSLDIVPLPELDNIPPEEKTTEFIAAFERAKLTDEIYLDRIAELDKAQVQEESFYNQAELDLRDRVRTQLGLGQRQKKKTIDRSDYAREKKINPDPNLEIDKTHADFLQTMRFKDELNPLLTKILQDANLAEQEMGLSTLYLAIGFLEWYESEDSDKRSYAPLLMLPISLRKKILLGQTNFEITIRDGDAETNLSLKQLLEQKFSGRQLPKYQSDDDEFDISIQKYFQEVEKCIEGLVRWKLHPWLVIGHFAFGRFAMYSDLDREKWSNITDHKLVGAILHGAEAGRDPNDILSLPADYDIESMEFETLAPFLISDADSSQHSALIDALKGNNLVVQGPPGTGKSQTITNIIANAISNGKKVLFVAEKRAALEVVKRRLDAAGLGSFCLELHSDRSSPKQVIQSLKNRVELGYGYFSDNEEGFNDPEWRAARNILSGYVRAINGKTGSGRTLHNEIWNYIKKKSRFQNFEEFFNRVKIPSRLLRSGFDRDVILKLVEEYSRSLTIYESKYGDYNSSPWHNYKLNLTSAADVRKFINSCRQLVSALLEKKNLCLSYPGIDSFRKAEAIDILNKVLSQSRLPRPQEFELINQLGRDNAHKLVEHHKKIKLLIGKISEDAEAAKIELEILDDAIDASKYSSLSRSSNEPYISIRARLQGEISRKQKNIISLKTLRDIADKIILFKGAVLIDCIVAYEATTLLKPLNETEFRRLNQLHETSEEYLVKFEDRLNDLLARRQSWIKKLGQDIAGNKELKTALERLIHIENGSLFLRGLSKINGERGKLRQIIKQFGFPKKISHDELRLAVEYLIDYEKFYNDQEIGKAFGADWKGLDTPIDEIKKIYPLLEKIKNILEKSERRNVIFKSLLTLEYKDLLYLGRHEISDYKHDQEYTTQIIDEVIKSEELLVEEALEIQRHITDRLVATQLSPSRAVDMANLKKELSIEKQMIQQLVLGISNSERYDQEWEFIESCLIWFDEIEKIDAPSKEIEKLQQKNAIEVATTVRNKLITLNDIQSDIDQILLDLEKVGVGQNFGFSDDEKMRLLNELIGISESLGSFVQVVQASFELEKQGFGFIIDELKKVRADLEDYREICDALISYSEVSSALINDELAELDGSKIEHYRSLFVKKDVEKIKIDQEIIKRRLLTYSPPTGSSFGPRRTWTNMSLLASEFPKQKRFLPVRQLIARAGSAITELMPCVMMSPLSLAKYLEPGGLEFDLLVIDEASQMRPEDALGALLRANQIVVVGDPKQLPPTDFFTRAEDDINDDDEEDIDAESILDICDATFGKRRRLKWHYRSNCESLIAFSNYHFYGNGLITFPKPAPDVFSISLNRVDGEFQARCNPIEAKAIAEAAFNYVRTEMRNSEENVRSFGIVALNVQQRELIQEEFSRLSSGDELYEDYLRICSDKGEEPFIKNLENVQGDERDTMFISMTYGKNAKTGIMHQRFGPINGKQGHRRLNVLFTRARSGIELFTSFDSSDVKVKETSSEGVKILHSYLEYAETRGRAFVEIIDGEADSDFEVEVAERLAIRGFKVEFQVGVSGYKIDIGVRHPDNESIFLAGVECDGATYHSSASARDRDRIREEVLKRLGWNLVRVWSTDWFENPDKETDKLVSKLMKLREEFGVK